MKRIFLIFNMLICTNLYAVGMCVPDTPIINNYGYWAVHSSGSTEEGERGFFEIGRQCRNGKCGIPLIRGETHCSVSYDWTASNWETVGSRCFCRITHVVAPNGYMAPLPNTAWVFQSVLGWPNEEPYISKCVSMCPQYCGHITELGRIRTMLTARVGD